MVLLLLLTACAPRYRVSRGSLGLLLKKGEPFVLVFGSLSRSSDVEGVPTIRFSHPATKSQLEKLEIPRGGKFSAVLRAPDPSRPLDEFYVEVGSANAGFDRIVFTRVSHGERPQALYLGEIAMSAAIGRDIRSHMLRVTVHDQLETATRDLRREYPRFSGPVGKAIAVRSTGATSPAPERR